MISDYPLVGAQYFAPVCRNVDVFVDVFVGVNAAAWVCVRGLGFDEVGVDEVELFGGEEALGLLVTGGLKFGVEGLAEDDHLHQIAYSIAGVAHREVEQG